MATVRMRKGDLYADIYDSEETIATAVREGYVLAEGGKSEQAEQAKEAGKSAKPKAKK